MDDKKVKTIFSNNLKKYMNMVGVNQNDIAKITGVSQQSVSNWINRKQIPRMGIIERLADYFGILKSDLLEDKDDVSNGIKIPILGTVIAGIPVTAVEDIIGYEEISEKMARCGDYFALEIKGDSMEPKMSKGDIVIVKQQNTVENGQIAIVLVNGDEATVKKVRFRDNGIELIAFNSYVYEPHFYSAKEIDELPVKIIGRVVELRAKF
ncbi:MAG: helix-turn-helix domain-containing protein [Coprobacillus cateniformis]|nr:helix-turn-helix domain-containing protein [Coprobacillus cateniformis]